MTYGKALDLLHKANDAAICEAADGDDRRMVRIYNGIRLLLIEAASKPGGLAAEILEERS